MENVNTLIFTDAELSVLNDVVRQHKLSLTNEELVMVALGKRTSPLVDITLKVGSAWERRAQELQNPEAKKTDSEAVQEDSK